MLMCLMLSPGTSLVAQLVKNLPAMRESWVRSLGWEDPLEEGKGYPLQYFGLENSMDCIVHGVTKSWTQLSDFHFQRSLRLSCFPFILFSILCSATVISTILSSRSFICSSASVILLLIPCNPLQYSCLENPVDGEAWQATVHGIAKSQTRLSDFTSLQYTIHLCLFAL